MARAGTERNETTTEALIAAEVDAAATALQQRVAAERERDRRLERLRAMLAEAGLYDSR